MKTPHTPPATSTARRPSLNEHLFSHAKAPDELRHLILDIARAAKYIHFAIRTTEAGLAGTVNQFGEEQLKLDVVSDDIIQAHLLESRLVASFASEENDKVIVHKPSNPYSVVYDPLDGSSLVDVNFAIGSIFGIYPGAEIIGRKPREQAAALYVLYGPRTVLVYAAGNGTHMFLLNDVGEFVLLRENLGVADAGKTYSPGNLRAVNENAGYKKLLNAWLDDELTLRYSGCMVADVHHILAKGQGIFTNVGGSSYPEGKLRLAFECGPLAYLVEQAGGKATDGSTPILEKPIDDIGRRTPFICGSTDAVKKAEELLV
jgi:fructose-1,6-bisphosphatase I